MTSAAKRAQEAAYGDSLVERVERLWERVLGLLTEAENCGDYRGALVGIREARSTIELLARLQGQMAERHVVELANYEQAAAMTELVGVIKEIQAEQHLMTVDITKSPHVYEGRAALPALPPGYRDEEV